MGSRGSRRSSEKRRKSPESDAAGVRIIGGKLRGSILAFAGQQNTRPMKDRTREAVFNLIGPEAKGKHAVDLFAGTGALGFEAISRGAAAATFIERHFPSARLLETSAHNLGLSECTQVCTSDTFFWVEKSLPKSKLPREGGWLVFCSPPYDLFVERPEDMCGMLEQLIELSPPSSIFVVESDDRFDVGKLSNHIEWDIRSYPPAIVAWGETANVSE